MVNDNALVIKNISVCFDGFYALTDVNANVKETVFIFLSDQMEQVKQLCLI